MVDDCKYLLKLDGQEEDISNFDKKVRSKKEGGEGDILLIGIYMIGPGIESYRTMNEFFMAKYGSKGAMPVIYNKESNTYFFEVRQVLKEEVFINMSQEFSELKFTCEYKNFRYEENEIADYCKFTCQNGSIEYIEQSKIRCSFCFVCGSVESFERI